MKYTYVDGSGNKYKLQNSKLTYIPLTPENSSSGTYSGGDPFVLELEKIDLIRLVDVFERALWSESDHSNKRRMGSGTLFKTVGEDWKRIYLSYGSTSINEIDAILKSIKSV